MGTNNEQQTALSTDAQRLLHVLQVCCHARHLAKPDRELAVRLELPERSMVDLADELLAAGHLVIAETIAPMGRWILDTAQDLAPAKSYDRVLGSRAVKIFRRRRNLRRAIYRVESARAVESTGQRRLFA